MKLPIPNILPKKEKPEYLLTLLLRDEKVSAVIVEQFQGKIKVIGQHTEYFTTSLDETNSDELLDLLDKSISHAEETLPPDMETRKTIFGVKDEWVEEKKIKKEHLAKLKKVSDTLDLTPIGFLVISEAVAHLIQEEEGAPLSAILAEVGTKSINLVLLRGGKVIDSKLGPIEESPMHTVDTLLKHFTIEVLPSRIIVFGGKNQQDLTQKFITHTWSKSLPFLHVPQVSVLPENFDARSIVFGAAKQMNLEVLEEIAHPSGSEIKTFEHGEKAKLDTEEAADETAEGEKPKAKSKIETEDTEESVAPPMSGDNFGFVNEADIAEMKPRHHEVPPTEDNNSPEENRQSDTEEDAEEASTAPLDVVKAKAMLAVAAVQKLPALLKKSGGVASPLKGNKIILLPVALVVLLIVLTILYIFNVRGKITLNLAPKVIEKEETVDLSPDAVNDFANHTLQASSISSSLDGSVSTNATGKKDVGDKAKGTVTIYNNNDSQVTLPSGTTITSSNNLSYTLDKDVSIASESGDIFTGTKPGTAQVSVTAKDIGTDYNLPSSTKFTVSGASNVAAKNDSAFSGGSKKTVTVVSQSDLNKLLSDLPKSLEDNAKSDLQTKVDSDSSLLPGFTDESIATKSFDKKVDDEAKTVTLKGKVTFTALTYKKSDLSDFGTSILKNDFSQDLHISDKGVTTEVKDVKKKDDTTFEVTLGIKADLLPDLDTDTIKKDLTGKSVSTAKDYLSRLPQVSSSTITLTPPLPFLPQFLPRVTNHITVEVKTNE